jgi:hypothetical protein
MYHLWDLSHFQNMCCSFCQVWKADWAGTEVAVKELLSIREHAHGRAAQRHQARRAQEAVTPEPPGEGEDEGDSDTDRWGVRLRAGQAA